MLKPFAIEFQPLIDDITGKERTVKEYANIERIRSMLYQYSKYYKPQQMLMMAQGPPGKLRRWRIWSLICEQI